VCVCVCVCVHSVGKFPFLSVVPRLYVAEVCSNVCFCVIRLRWVHELPAGQVAAYLSWRSVSQRNSLGCLPWRLLFKVKTAIYWKWNVGNLQDTREAACSVLTSLTAWTLIVAYNSVQRYSFMWDLRFPQWCYRMWCCVTELVFPKWCLVMWHSVTELVFPQWCSGMWHWVSVSMVVFGDVTECNWVSVSTVVFGDVSLS